MAQDHPSPRSNATTQMATDSEQQPGHSASAGTPSSTVDASRNRPFETRHIPYAAIGIVGFTAVLWWLAGLWALPITLLIGAVWYSTTAPYAVVVAHIALVALAPNVPGVALIPFEASAFVLLLGNAPDVDNTLIGLVLAGLIGAAGLGGVAYSVLSISGTLWLAILVLTVVFALSAYGLHRYALVRRYLREGADEQ